LSQATMQVYTRVFFLTRDAVLRRGNDGAGTASFFFCRVLRDEMRGWVCLSTDADSRPTGFDRCTNRPRERPKGPNLPVVREGTRAPVFSSPSLNLLFSATRAEIDVHALVPKGGSSTFAQQMFGK
jgi:hypothetical protein